MIFFSVGNDRKITDRLGNDYANGYSMMINNERKKKKEKKSKNLRKHASCM